MQFSVDTSVGKRDSIDKKNGIIKGVKLVSEGEAKGHDVFLSKKFIKDTVNLAKKKKKLKARFGHPGFFSDAIGTYLGVFKNFRLKVEQLEDGTRYHAKADLFLSESAKKAPGGDLFSYVLALAENDNEEFGTSIVFRGESYEKEDKEGNVKRYATIKDIMAADLVDEPAATESLFSKTNNNSMSLFNRKKKEVALTSSTKDDKTIIHFGELKEGTEITVAGSDADNFAGTYELADGSKITVDEENLVSNIELEVVEFDQDAMTTAFAKTVGDAIAPLIERLDAIETEFSELKGNPVVEHTPEEKKGVDNEAANIDMEKFNAQLSAKLNDKKTLKGE